MHQIIKSSLLSAGLFLAFPSNVFAVCDECAKAALDLASSSMTTNIKATTTVVTTNGTAISALSTLNSANSAALQLQLSTLSQQELTALDGVATKISLQLQKNSKSTQINMDNLILNIEKISESEEENYRLNYLDRTFGPLSKPMSGQINLPRSLYLERALEVKEVMKTTFIDGFYQWLNNPASEDALRIDQAALLEDEGFFDVSALIQKKVISSADLERFKSLLQIMIESKPQHEITAEEAVGNPALLAGAIFQRQKKVKQQIVHSIMTEAVMDRAPFIIANESWSKNYLSFNEDEQGMVSFSQFYEAETLGKLTSKEWYQDISKLTDAGLLREQIHQANTTNMLLSEILKAERNEAKLIAIKALTGGR